MSYRVNFGWRLYPWFEEHGVALIHPSDQAAFVELFPYGKVFAHVGNEGPYLALSYGPRVFRVKPKLFRPVPVTPLPVGTEVKIIEKNLDAVIDELHWHWKREAPFYILRYGGKRHSRRYWDAELRALT